MTDQRQIDVSELRDGDIVRAKRGEHGVVEGAFHPFAINNGWGIGSEAEADGLFAWNDKGWTITDVLRPVLVEGDVMAFTATPPRCETCGRWHIPNDPPDCAHEPECGFMTDETLDCICGEIRACEARVRADERDKAAGRVEARYAKARATGEAAYSYGALYEDRILAAIREAE